MDDTQQIPIDARIYVCGQKSIIKSGDNFTCTKPTDQTYERRAGDAWLFNMFTKFSSISSKLGEYKIFFI